MKYIYIILICFLGIATQAQVQKQPRSNFPTVVDSSLAIGKNFILPVFRSFSQLSTYTALDSSGRLVFIRDSNAVFYRDNAHQWVKFNSGSSGSAVWGSITGTLSNQTDLQAVLDTKVDSVILRGGDSLYNHYATGEVQFIGVVSGGGSTGDTLRVTFPLYVNATNDTLSIPQASTDSSGYLSSSDWNYFAVKPDSTVLNATGDTLLSYLGSTVIYSKAIAGGSSGWSLTGNAGTNSTVNFIGTKDAQPFIIKVNNSQVARFGINDANTAIGTSSVASGIFAFALGFNANASGDVSCAIGASSIASGNASVCIGQNLASGESSIAMGSGAVSSGIASTSIGVGTISDGTGTISTGRNSRATGDYSYTIGDNTTSNSKYSLVIGRANDTTGQVINDTSILFQIGNGYVNDDPAIVNPSNLLTATYTGVGIGTTTPAAKLHIASSDSNAVKITGLINTVLGTDSALVIGTDGLVKKAAKSSGGGVSTAQLTDSLNARGATYLQVNNPSATGSFTLTSTTGGITNSRVTTTQMNAISSPVAGTQVYNTDYASLMEYSTEWGWTSDNTDWKIRNMIDYSNDFTGVLFSGTASISDGMLTTSVVNSGLIDTGQVATTNRPGLVKLSTNANAAGQARIATGTGTLLQTMSLGGGRIVLETAVYMNVLPSAAERYSVLSGFSTTNNSVSVSNGVLFVYDSSGVVTGSTASPNWQVCTDSANSRTFSNSGVAVAANTWYNLKAVVNAAGNSVEFYINDVLVKTETRTIPILPVGIMTQIYKGGGTTARTLHVDYMRYKQKFTTSR